MAEFASEGYSGARVDAIAARTRTSKRMIYYYFGGKEQLYLAVLEEAYRSIRALEDQLDIASCDAREGLRRLIEATFDHDERNPNFIRLVSIENIHHGKHLKQNLQLRQLNASVIATLDGISKRGRARRRLPRRRRRHRSASGHLLLLLLPRRQPPHLRRAVRPRPQRAQGAGEEQDADRGDDFGVAGGEGLATHAVRTDTPAFAVMPREGGESSTPRPIESTTTVSGILDHPPSRAMTPRMEQQPLTRPSSAARSPAAPA